MKKMILLYAIPLKYPILKDISGQIILDKSLSNEEDKTQWILNKYLSLGESFEERYNNIKDFWKDPLAHGPTFWDHPELILKTIEE